MATATVTYSPKTVVGARGIPEPAPAPKVATVSTPLTHDILWAAVGVGAVIGSAFVAIWLSADDAFPPEGLPPVGEGLTIFATFYVVAQAVERLLEPLSGILLKKDVQEKGVTEKDATAQAAVNANPASADQAVQAAARAKADLAAREQQRAVLFWIIASVVGVAVSAGMKLYFLQRVGIANSSRWWEVLATGLIIGAGTKPLHDVIEFISAKKEDATSPVNAAQP